MRLSNKYPFLTHYFEQAINTTDRTFPQSLLFWGNDLNAQYELATEIARLLNCKNNKDDECECLNCRWIKEGSHPAVMTISKIDNKPEDDSSKTVISVKQSQMIKELLLNSSEFHRVFIFCDRDNDGNIAGLNFQNFQEETTNSLLKIVEEPQPGVTFIFLTRYKDDVLSTIISRSQCFFIPSSKLVNFDDSYINDVFAGYLNLESEHLFDITQNLHELSKEYSAEKVLDCLQNGILSLIKSNPERVDLIRHIKYVEDAKYQLKIGMRPTNIFEDLCYKLIK